MYKAKMRYRFDLKGAALLAEHQVGEAALLVPLSTQSQAPQGPHCIARHLLHLRLHCTHALCNVFFVIMTAFVPKRMSLHQTVVIQSTILVSLQ